MSLLIVIVCLHLSSCIDHALLDFSLGRVPPIDKELFEPTLVRLTNEFRVSSLMQAPYRGHTKIAPATMTWTTVV